jgi:hypothetical protein
MRIDDMTEYVTEAELQKRLKVSRYMLWSLRRTRPGLPYRRIRGSIRYEVSEVDAWLSAHCQGQKQIEPVKKGFKR